MKLLLWKTITWLIFGLHIHELFAKHHHDHHHKRRHEHDNHHHRKGIHHRLPNNDEHDSQSSSTNLRNSHYREHFDSFGLPSEWIEDADYSSSFQQKTKKKKPNGFSSFDDDEHETSDSFFDETGRIVINRDFAQESKKQVKVDPAKGNVFTIHTRVFSNITQGGDKISYSGQNVFYDNQPTLHETTTTTKRPSTDHIQQPIPMASHSHSNLNDHNYVGHSRWTLKYKGMPSEGDLNNTRVNITAKMGGGAFLPCKVGHLGGDRQISWIRRRDWHVLTSGKILYTHDKRFTVLHEPGSQDWTLHIKLVNMRDAGNYECQVSTGTGIISLFVKLDVVIPEAYIPGHGQYHVDRGSTISLSCYIKNSPAPPQYILWHHNGQLLNFLRDRPDIRITDDLQKIRTSQPFQFTVDNGVDSGFTEEMHANAERTMSRLQVDVAEDHHSGNYSCSAPNTLPASTLVFITEGDKPAAVQRIDSGVVVCSANKFIILFILSLESIFAFS